MKEPWAQSYAISPLRLRLSAEQLQTARKMASLIARSVAINARRGVQVTSVRCANKSKCDGRDGRGLRGLSGTMISYPANNLSFSHLCTQQDVTATSTHPYVYTPDICNNTTLRSCGMKLTRGKENKIVTSRSVRRGCYHKCLPSLSQGSGHVWQVVRGTFFILFYKWLLGKCLLYGQYAVSRNQ